MWRLGNWISCRKELDFIKSQYREHARASIFLQSLKEHFKVKSGELSKMSVNWVRFPCCSAGPTSAALISSNISQNQPTPHPALHKCTSVHCKFRLKITLLWSSKLELPHKTHCSQLRSRQCKFVELTQPVHCACACGSQAEGIHGESTKLWFHNFSFPTSPQLLRTFLPAGVPIAGGSEGERGD